MKRRTAGFAFFAISLILAILLLTQTIEPVIAGAAFAIALAVLGVSSAGFTHK
jgi:hypothetical protein